MKRIAMLGLLVGVGAQLVPVERSNPPVETVLGAPGAVQAVLERSCYDCHSNQTRWPWYTYVAPASWFVTSEVAEAREKLNFSTWNAYSVRKQAGRFKVIAKELSQGDMPVWSYVALHPESRLSPDDAALLSDWATSSRDALTAQIDADKARERAE